MRWFVDLLVVIAVVTAAGGFVWIRSQRQIEQADVASLIHDCDRLELEIKARATTNDGDIELNSRGWPRSIDPNWFLTNRPENLLLQGNRAWLEVASELEAYLQHPLHRAATRAEHATFWYNPYNGVVRARIPMQTTDDETLRLYNLVNGSELLTLHTIEHMPKDDMGLRDYMRIESQIRLARKADITAKATQAALIEEELAKENATFAEWAELTDAEIEWYQAQ